jgi:hypothetical protein
VGRLVGGDNNMDDGDVVGLIDDNGQRVGGLVGGDPKIGDGDIVGFVDVNQCVFGDGINKGFESM